VYRLGPLRLVPRRARPEPIDGSLDEPALHRGGRDRSNYQ
jgi:hypothetical protein